MLVWGKLIQKLRQKGVYEESFSRHAAWIGGKLIQFMHTTMVPVQVKTMKIQAGVQVSRQGELRRHLQLWKQKIVLCSLESCSILFSIVVCCCIVDYLPLRKQLGTSIVDGSRGPDRYCFSQFLPFVVQCTIENVISIVNIFLVQALVDDLLNQLP
ncbi:hypothetical protein Tco_1449125 [Tanacetum coccineum]